MPETITVEDTDLHLETAGEGDPLLLVHGLGSASTTWEPQLASLSEAGYRAIAPDMPGFGRSEKPQRSYTPAFFVDVLASLLDELGVEETYIVGASMGGHVTLEFALRHPERIHGTVAEAPGGVPPADFQGTEALATYTQVLDAETVEDVVQTLEAVRPDGLDEPEHVRDPAEILAYVESPGARQAFDSALLGSSKARRLGPLLDEIEPAPLLVWGERDPMIPLDVCRPELAQAEEPRLAVFPECGHGPHREEPELFNRLVREHFRGRLRRADVEEAAVRLDPPLAEVGAGEAT